MPTDRSDAKDIDSVDRYLVAAIRGEAPPPPGPDAARSIPERARYHGLTALLLDRPEALARLPAEMVEQLRRQALSFTAWEIRDRAVLLDVLAALAERGLRAALLKGAALAYGCYASPAERPRGDSDILVAEADWEAARDALLELGFDPGPARASERILQEEFTLTAGNGSVHCVDLHRNLLPAFALSDLFRTETLQAAAVPVPALGPHAFRLSDADALLHACIHRAKHFTTPYFIDGTANYAGDHLIWFHDMHLLARRMSAADWARFEAAAIDCGGAPLCRDGLARSAELLGTDLPPGLLDRLSQAPDTGLLNRHLAQASLARRIWSDLLSVPEGQSRLAYLRQIFLPPAALLRQKYPELDGHSLIRLHLHRYRERLGALRRERRQRSGQE